MPKLVKDDKRSYTIKFEDGREQLIAKMNGHDPIYEHFKAGGKVPGKAAVKGDSPKNDTVVAKLSPGEIVIPRSHAGSFESAMKFLKGMKGFADGGEVKSDDGDDADCLEADKVDGKCPKKEDDEFVKANQPTPIIGVNYKGGRIKGYQDGGEVIVDENGDGIDDSEETATGTDTVTAPPVVGEIVPPVTSTATATESAPAGIGAPPPDQTVTGTPAQPGAATPNPPVPPVTQEAVPPKTTTTTQEGTKSEGVNPKIVKKQEAATSELLGANIEAGKLAAEKLRAQASIVQNDRLETEKRNVRIEQEDMARTLERQKFVDRIKGAVDDANALGKVDPSHIWGSEGTGNRIAAAIGMIIGGMGSALTGKENGAIKIIESAIDRDIKVQESNITQAEGKVKTARGGLQSFLDAGLDIDAARAAEKARQLENTSKQLDVIERSNAPAATLAEINKGNAEIKKKSADEAAKVNGYVQTKEAKTSEVAPKMAPRQVREKYRMNDNLQTGLKRLRELKTKTDTGFIASGRAKVGQHIDMANVPEYDKLQTELNGLVDQYITANDLPKTSKSIDLVKKTIFPELTMDDATWNSKLDELDNKLGTTKEGFHNQYGKESFGNFGEKSGNSDNKHKFKKAGK